MPNKILQLKRKDKNNKVRSCGKIEIKNQTENEADLCFFGDINSETMGEWKAYYPEDKAPSDVKEFLDQLGNVSKINVYINSGGGSVFGGIAIHNMLKRYDAEIIVHVEALAASIASVIAFAGNKIFCPKNANIMIHKPSSWAAGNADDFRKEADVLDTCQEAILAVYMEHAKEGVTEEQINELINAETWGNGEFWAQYFDIKVEEASEAVAAADSEYYAKYKNLPEALKKKEEIVDAEKMANRIAAKVLEKLKAKQEKQENEPGKEAEKKALLEDLDLY